MSNYQNLLGHSKDSGREGGGAATDDTERFTTNDLVDAIHNDGAPEGSASSGPADPLHGYGDEEYGSVLDQVKDLAQEYWHYALMGVAVIVGLYIVLHMMLGGGDSSDAGNQGADAGGAASQQQAAGGQVQDTGVKFDQPTKDKDGTYYLKAGAIAWKGKFETSSDGDQLTLEGPTSAQFKKAVDLPNKGTITDGVFGRAEPKQPIVHGEYHSTAVGDQEVTDGTYHVIKDDKVLIEGTYQDQRSGDTVTRTYDEHPPDAKPGNDTVYAVSFQAPKGTPIPALIGWKPPQGVGQNSTTNDQTTSSGSSDQTTQKKAS